MTPTLSILIPTLGKRKMLLDVLLDNLHSQIRVLDTLDVEIVIELDNGQLTTGAKRNLLLKKANGKYIVFVDDDDFLAGNYIMEILNACATNCDCIGFSGWMTTDNRKHCKWHISKDFDYKTIIEADGSETYLRPTNHIAPVKREIAIQIMFPDKTFGEDYIYCMGLKKSGLLKTETIIEKSLYHYRFSTFK